MNELQTKKTSLPALAMDKSELMAVLKNSLYPDAQDESITLVLGYCKAAGLDPMQKPVHIVPMWSPKAKAMRDIIMPGIGLYRIQAARTGLYAGISEPVFGPEKTMKLGGQEVTFPEWCSITVKRRMEDGSTAEFTATERWLENYAVKGGQEKSVAPNAMWARRTYGQIAKCAEAQALRKAFPEVGSQATADETEGKYYAEEGDYIDANTGEIVPTRVQQKPDPKHEPEKVTYPNERFVKKAQEWINAIEGGNLTIAEVVAHMKKWELSMDQLAVLNGEMSLDEFINIDNATLDNNNA